LDDFNANVEGAKEILNLFRTILTTKDEVLVAKVDTNFKAVDAILQKYRKGDGFETYDKLSEADKKALKAPINTLAEDLAKFRGVLGLD
jgi:iron uptake system component EfeO